MSFIILKSTHNFYESLLRRCVEKRASLVIYMVVYNENNANTLYFFFLQTLQNKNLIINWFSIRKIFNCLLLL